MSSGFDELTARARRGELSRDEQQRLDVFLKSSLEARLWHEAGRELDAEDRVLPGDHDAVERVMHRALSALSVRPARSRRPTFALIAVAALCLASVAAASIEGVRYLRAQTKSVIVNARARAGNGPDAFGKAQPVVAVAHPVAVGETPASPPLPLPPAPLTSTAISTPPSVSVSVSAIAAAAPVVSAARAANATKPVSKDDAASLYGAAARARREGNAVKAIALLDSLQERFPSSREARFSDMTLGALHLRRGAAADALEHFRRYLQVSPGGELASEALWGESQALAALGRQAESERRLEQLLQRFPSSAYATAARAKLKSAGP